MFKQIFLRLDFSFLYFRKMFRSKNPKPLKYLRDFTPRSRPVFLLLILLISFAITPLAEAQTPKTSNRKALKSYETALEYFNRRQNTKALEFCEKAIAEDSSFAQAYMMMAQLYKEEGKDEMAVESFKKAVVLQNDPEPEMLYLLASELFKTGKYEETAKFLSLLTKNEMLPAGIQNKAEGLQKKNAFALHSVQNPVPFEPVNLGDSVNSILNEYWPSLSLDEEQLFITVRLPARKSEKQNYSSWQEDFYFSRQKDDGSWGLREKAGGFINSALNEGAQSISSDGKVLYFTGCDRIEGFGKCDLYVSYKHGDNWSSPLNLGGIINSSHSDKHPSVSSDNRSLFFASDRPGGFGGLDIWVCHKNTVGGWSKPLNLGDSINTSGDEQSPFIHPDNTSLFFSSTGHNNMGRGDIFLSTQLENGKWTAPENLGYPVNTHNDEVGLIVNAAGNTAYYASDRNEGRGMDIYRFELYEKHRPVAVSYLRGRVYDSETCKSISANFELINYKTGELVHQAVSNPADGEFLLPVKTNNDYILNVSHPGYLFFSDHFELSGIFDAQEPFVRDVALDPIRKGNTTILKNIFFDFDEAEILPESETELAKVVDFLIKNSNLRVKINGHTDNTGGADYNLALSERRAKAVVDYLIQKGINKQRLEYEGFGFTRPLSDNTNEEGRALNRRTEMEIID